MERNINLKRFQKFSSLALNLIGQISNFSKKTRSSQPISGWRRRASRCHQQHLSARQRQTCHPDKMVGCWALELLMGCTSVKRLPPISKHENFYTAPHSAIISLRHKSLHIDALHTNRMLSSRCTFVLRKHREESIRLA
jgi:hypothetical protein